MDPDSSENPSDQINLETIPLEIRQEGSIQFYSFDPTKYSDGGSALTKSMPVFYNPIMVINRDITLIAYRSFCETLWDKNPDLKIKICDLMAASGIRSIRLLKYLPRLSKINPEKPIQTIITGNSDPLASIPLTLNSLSSTSLSSDSLSSNSLDSNPLESNYPIEIAMNDLNPGALRLIQKNCNLNGLTHGFKFENFEAIYFLEKSRVENHYFHIIDIDPFGTPNVFISSALRAISIGGLLGITATDTAVLFGVKRDACQRKYNTRSLKSTYLKEVGLRILIYFTAIRAHPYMLGIEPVASFSAEHFIRIFLKVKKGKEMVSNNLKQFGYVFWCPKCDWRSTWNLDLRGASFECPNCHNTLEYGGPLWLGPLHHKETVQSWLSQLEQSDVNAIPTKKILTKHLTSMIEEDNYPVGYYDIDKLCDLLNLCVPSMSSIMQTIQQQGFQAIRTHIDPNGIKTTIPLDLLVNSLKNLHQIYQDQLKLHNQQSNSKK